ncbi:hypothetical protein MAHJHV35_46550 [Mycobacterium avium subsp. hominissuis]
MRGPGGIHRGAYAEDLQQGDPRPALTGYFEAIDADQRRARITLLEILGVSPAVDAAWATALTMAWCISSAHRW